MKIKINNLTWKIVPFERTNETFDGQTDVPAMTIKFNVKQDNQIVEKTIIHELVHATLDSFGFGSYAKDTFSLEELCEFIAMNGENIIALKNQIVKRCYYEQKKIK